MSTTPRTDEAAYYHGLGGTVGVNFARTLETELSAEREKVRVLEEAAKPFIEYATAYGACTGSELWAPNGTKLKPRDWLTLAATKEGA